MKSLPFRWRAFGWHLLGSGIAALGAWLLATQVWFPWPLATLAGGMQLFLIVIGVDMVLGPSLTAVIANPAKPKRELVRDLAIILVLQLSAFGYGIYTLAAARPVLLAFEVDLFRVVSAAEVDTPSLPQAPAAFRTLSWTGPVTLAAIKPADPGEVLRTIELGLAGIPLAALPAYWRDYSSEKDKAWAKSQPLTAEAIARVPDPAELSRIAARAGVRATELRALPLLARRAEGTVLLAPPDARVVGILPVPLLP